jgi:hypothetical protein
VGIDWASVRGKPYQVQYKSDLETVEWSNLGGAITTAAATSSVRDDSLIDSTKRFYHLLL